MEKAVEISELLKLKKLLSLGTDIHEVDTSVFELLVTENDLNSLKFLKNDGHQINVSKSAFIKACSSGNLEMVQFLHENNNLSYIDNILPMEEAAQYSHDKIVKFLHEKGYKRTSLVMEWCAYNENFDMVEYLNKNNNTPVTTKTISFLLDFILN